MTDYEQIEKYLNNELSAEELAAFQQQMQQDAAFKQTVQLYSMIGDEMIKTKDEAALEQTLAAAGNKYFQSAAPPAKTILISRRSLIVYGAVAAAVTGIFFFIKLLLSAEPDAQHLFAQYYSFQPVSLAQRSDGTSSKTAGDTLAKIETFYNNKQFTEALALLAVWNSHHTDTELQMLQGNCLLQLGKTAEARNVFEPISSGQTAFKNEAAFNIALAYLRDNNIEACKTALQRIPADAAIHSRAASLLEALQ